MRINPSAMSLKCKIPKCIISFEDYLEFLPHIERKFYEVMPKRRLAAMYLAVWLSEVIFFTADREVRNGCIYPACKMAFGAN